MEKDKQTTIVGKKTRGKIIQAIESGSAIGDIANELGLVRNKVASVGRNYYVDRLRKELEMGMTLESAKMEYAVLGANNIERIYKVVTGDNYSDQKQGLMNQLKQGDGRKKIEIESGFSVSLVDSFYQEHFAKEIEGAMLAIEENIQTRELDHLELIEVLCMKYPNMPRLSIVNMLKGELYDIGEEYQAKKTNQTIKKVNKPVKEKPEVSNSGKRHSKGLTGEQYLKNLDRQIKDGTLSIQEQAEIPSNLRQYFEEETVAKCMVEISKRIASYKIKKQVQYKDKKYIDETNRYVGR